MPLLLNQKRVIVLAILFVGLCVVAAVSTPRLLFGSGSKTPLPQVRNSTNSVEISRFQQSSSGDFEMTLINKSNKTLYAYTIITSRNGIQKGFTTYATVEPLDPGSIRTEKIPPGNFQSGSMEPPDLVFSAAYFEGGNVEGDARESEKLSRTMKGMKDEAQAALEVLNGAIKSSEPDNERLLDDVESKASSMAAKPEAISSTHETERGRGMVTDRLSRDINKVRAARKDPAVSVKAKLQNLTAYYERLANKL